MRNTLIIASIFILLSCNNTELSRLEKANSFMSQNMLDSASYEINRINTSSLKSKKAMMYYRLLMTETKFYTTKNTQNDSLLDVMMDFFKESEDAEKYARVLYIKSYTAYAMNKKKEGTTYLKEAEKVSKDVDNNILKYRILNRLAFYNVNANELNTALEYSLKALICARKTTCKDILENSYESIAHIYGCMGQTDSAFAYMNKCIPLLKYLQKDSKAVLLGNIGAAYEAVDAKKSKEYVLKSIAIEPHDFTYHLLAALYLRENNAGKAAECWRKALALCKDTERKISIFEDVYEYEKGNGRYDKATAVADTLRSLRELLASEQRSDSIKSVEDYYNALTEIDKAVEEERNDTAAVALIIIVAVVTILAMVYVRKRNAYRRQTDKLSKEADNLKDKGQTTKKELYALRRKMKTLEERKDAEAQKNAEEWRQTMAHGFKLMETIKKHESNTSKWMKKDFEDFVAYYCAMNPTFNHTLENDYKRLTTDQRFLLILYDMGMDDQQVMKITGINIAALRMKKSRINKLRQTF